MATRRPLVLVAGQLQELPVGDEVAGAPAPGAAAFSSIEANLGSTARRSGSFLITGSGLTTGKPVMIAKAAGPYTGKGSRADEAEMDLITATGVVISATQIRVYWQSQGPVRGNHKFNYQIGA